MFQKRRVFSRPLILALVLGSTTVAAAGAATFHRLTVSQTTGSLGATAFLQNSPTGAALQGEVASSVKTNYPVPFGILGEYDAPGTAFGIGVLGISTTGYAVAGESLSSQPSLLGYAGGTGVGIEASTPATSTAEAIYAEAKGGGDGTDSYADTSDGWGIYGQASGNGEGVGGFAAGSGNGVNGEAEGGGAGVAAYGNTGYGVYGSSSTNDGVHANIANSAAALSGNNNGQGFGSFNYSSETSATPAPTAAPYANAGSFGQSQEGVGAYGVSLHCCSGVGYDSQRYPGVFGFGNSGPGVEGYSAFDIGVYAQNQNVNYPTVFIENESGTSTQGISLYAFNDMTDKITIAYSNGNFYTDGSITSGTDTYQAKTRNPSTDMTTYSAQHTEATIEDFGSAQLVNGVATVALAADFRQT